MFELLDNGTTAIMFAGGLSAPYAIFVDEGHAFRNNKGSFPGHHFMDVGLAAGEAVANTILREELRKQNIKVIWGELNG